MTAVTPRPIVGVYWMLLATLLFTSLDAIAKWLTQSYPVEQVVWARFFFHLVILGVYLGPRLVRSIRSSRLGLQLVRSALMLVTNVLFFMAVRTMPLADVVAVMFVGPLLVTALSVPLLGEQVGPRRWAAVAVGFAGALIIIRPGSEMLDGVAILPLCAAMTNALYTITTRQLRDVDPFMTTLLYTGLVGAGVSSMVVPFVWVAPDLRGWTLMVLAGTLGAGGHLAFIRALSISPPAALAPLSYSVLLWSTGYGYLLFGELPDSMTVFGAAIVMSSGLYVLHRERIRHHVPTPEPSPGPS
ncbi:MAG: drug/metabolite transporter (DMT)-like permease [Gammaproteobacteria bacterium]|jgi:drug/metabolite transporter (DMT)-like permease